MNAYIAGIFRVMRIKYIARGCKEQLSLFYESVSPTPTPFFKPFSKASASDEEWCLNMPYIDPQGSTGSHPNATMLNNVSPQAYLSAGQMITTPSWTSLDLLIALHVYRTPDGVPGDTVLLHAAAMVHYTIFSVVDIALPDIHWIMDSHNFINSFWG